MRPPELARVGAAAIAAAPATLQTAAMTSPTPHDLVLDVRQVRKAFTLHLRGGLRLPVLDDVSLQVHAGECVALVGASGCGKSTLMKCLWGSYHTDQGQLWLHPAAQAALEPAIDLARASAQQLIALRRRRMAYVSQFLRVLPRLSALDVVAQASLDADHAPLDDAPDDEGERADPFDDSLHGKRLQAARSHAADLLTQLKLPHGLWTLPPATFSGGEQQRINIARAFVRPARLLLLDEPTASLDGVNRRVVIRLIERAKAAGTAVVGIFHDEEVRDAVATRCLPLRAVSTRLT
jgi:alpha-D-ribose 1-methylphosphonate 5-triphosphate synthase subunit PhnL